MTEPYHLRSQLLSAKAAYEKAWQTSDVETMRALLNSMLFESARARRIARDAPELVKDCGLDRQEFLDVMNAVADLRNVMEHWTDPDKPRRREVSGHEIRGLKIAVDETSIVVIGPEIVLKGPLNLYDVYRFVCSSLSRMN